MFTTPLLVYPTALPNSVGDVEVQEPFDLLGYVYDSMVIIENELGIKELSTRQIFLPLAEVDKVEATMKISCRDSVQARIIKRKAYDGPGSKTLIGVLYLP
jgi:hypothetical protein